MSGEMKRQQMSAADEELRTKLSEKEAADGESRPPANPVTQGTVPEKVVDGSDLFALTAINSGPDTVPLPNIKPEFNVEDMTEQVMDETGTA